MVPRLNGLGPRQDFCAEVALEAEEEAKILRELHHPHIVARSIWCTRTRKPVVGPDEA
jgi:hypothetical protein